MTPARYSLGLVGYPLGHSLSPRLHAAALRSAGLEGEYRLYPLPPTSAGTRTIQSLLLRMRQGDIQGLNLTIPHKRTLLSQFDELTPVAEAVGAVNTICARDGKLLGDNTDVPGFRCDLDRQLSARGCQDSAIPKNALVLGAGGAARAAVYSLLDEGWEVWVAARRTAQAEELAICLQKAPGIADFPRSTARVTAIHLDAHALREAIAALSFSLVVNTTPLGMSPALDGCVWPLEVPLPGKAFVYDLVYNPPETRLMRAARVAGLPAASGIGMLVEQAAISFTAWTGISPDREAMYAEVGEGSEEGKTQE